ncbi:MAG: MGMT family protein [Candidatus Altiarchaeota archaeon]
MEYFARLQKETLELVKQIPRGRVSTYGCLARALGSGRLARVVGMALNRNPNPVRTPCHRIVRSDGSVGGYRLGIRNKIRLLDGEGVVVRSGKIKDFEKRLFNSFRVTTPRPP